MFILPSILAAGGVTALSILFLIVSIGSWLWNVFNANQKGAAGGAGRPQPQAGGGKRVDNELQAEINRFLKNVMGQKGGREDELEVLVVEEAEARTRSRQKNRGKRPAAQKAAIDESAESASVFSGPRPGGRISQRKGPGSTTLGSGVRQHLAEHMQEGRVTQQAQSHMAHGVADKVQQDLGTFSAKDAPTPAAITAARASVTASEVVRLMRDPAGVKQAFVLNLILNRPAYASRRRNAGPTR